MNSKVFVLLWTAIFAASASSCATQPSPSGPCGTVAASTCEIDAKKICEAAKDLESPINGFADTQSQREQNLRPTWTWMQSLNTPSGAEIGISCEMNVQHHRVIYASAPRGQALTPTDVDYLQNQGLCLNSPASSAAASAACVANGASPETGAANASGAPPPGASSMQSDARMRTPGPHERGTGEPAPGALTSARGASGGQATSTGAESGEWLDRLNAYRRAAGLRAVTEDRAESDGDLKHARYLVKNFQPGVNPGAEGHLEKQGNPWFTHEGSGAGQTSDVIPPSKGLFDDDTAIDGWLSAPFHALPMLDPDLAEAGFGRYCENDSCAAVLNVGRGGKWRHDQKLVSEVVEEPNGGLKRMLNVAPRTLNRPIEFPPPGSTIHNGAFNGMEWPNPLSACPGYRPPTGTVILISFGSAFEPAITSASISDGGRPLDSCRVTADSYESPNPAESASAKGNLKLYAAALLIPRDPLEPGKTYDVVVTKDGTDYAWSFKIEPKGLIVSE